METPLSHFTFEPKPDWFDRYKYYLLAVLLIILAGSIYLILTPPAATLADTADTRLAGGTELSVVSADPANQLVVDIAGGVIKPGIYWLNTGSIIEDAIKAAGGFSKSADLNAIGKTINRAQELTNHGKVYIPKVDDTNLVYPSPSPTNPSTTQPTGNLINLNTADNAELDLLPGIGEILSQRIIDYRLQHDGFSTIDELKEVPGINDSRFEQIKDLVTI